MHVFERDSRRVISNESRACYVSGMQARGHEDLCVGLGGFGLLFKIMSLEGTRMQLFLIASHVFCRGIYYRSPIEVK